MSRAGPLPSGSLCLLQEVVNEHVSKVQFVTWSGMVMSALERNQAKQSGQERLG